MFLGSNLNTLKGIETRWWGYSSVLTIHHHIRSSNHVPTWRRLVLMNVMYPYIDLFPLYSSEYFLPVLFYFLEFLLLWNCWKGVSTLTKIWLGGVEALKLFGNGLHSSSQSPSWGLASIPTPAWENFAGSTPKQNCFYSPSCSPV